MYTQSPEGFVIPEDVLHNVTMKESGQVVTSAEENVAVMCKITVSTCSPSGTSHITFWWEVAMNRPKHWDSWCSRTPLWTNKHKTENQELTDQMVPWLSSKWHYRRYTSNTGWSLFSWWKLFCFTQFDCRLKGGRLANSLAHETEPRVEISWQKQQKRQRTPSHQPHIYHNHNSTEHFQDMDVKSIPFNSAFKWETLLEKLQLQFSFHAFACQMKIAIISGR